MKFCSCSSITHAYGRFLNLHNHARMDVLGELGVPSLNHCRRGGAGFVDSRFHARALIIEDQEAAEKEDGEAA